MNARSYEGAGLLVLGAILLLFGAHFNAPERIYTLGSPYLVYAALAAHLGGALLMIIGGYRLFKAMRGS